MTKNELFTVLKDFIDDKNPGILVIKGKWGIGKTHIWNEYITSKRDEISKIKYYSYNSLFGINNISKVKQNIFQNLIKNENGFHDNREIDISDYHIHENIKNKKYREKIFRRIPTLLTILPQISNYSELIIDSTFMSIKSPLICIDDIERRNDNLNLKEIFGLISFLKEYKKAKVILILNDYELNEKDDYKKFKEKIIDVEVKYEPDVENCINLIFPDELKYIEIRQNIKKCNINNIRIIKKIKYFYDILIREIKTECIEISRIISHRLPVLVLAHYSNLNDINIDINFLLNIKDELSNYKVEQMLNKKEQKIKATENNELLAMLIEYEWNSSDYFDKFISITIESGYINKANYLKVLKYKEAEIIKNKNITEFSEAWDKYHDSFISNQDEVLKALENGFKNNVNNIIPVNFNGTILLFKDLNENEKASELIDFYIENNKKEIKEADEFYIFDGISDEEIKTKIIKVREGDLDDLKFDEIIKKIIENTHLNKKDFINLNKSTCEDFFKLFKEMKGKNLRVLVHRFIRYKNVENIVVHEVYKKVEEALKKISEESAINKRRVENFGINIE